MGYNTINGNLCYYDNIYYDYRTCDATLLFILGLEAVTESYYNETCSCDTCNIENCDNVATYSCNKPDCACKEYKRRGYNIIINKNIGQDNSYTLPLYDNIVNYINSIGVPKIYTNPDYIEYGCFGLKRFISELTGEGLNKTIPIFLKDYTQFNKIGFTSDNDKNTNRFITILTNAGYNKNEGTIPYTEIPLDLDDNSKNCLKCHNNKLKNQHVNKIKTSNLYKYLDYNPMYSYALGVLYGCTCLGYNENQVWCVNPSNWYEGQYTNLVNTAWHLFRFRYTHFIKQVDNDPDLFYKYKGITLNKLYNFSTDSNSKIILDEIACRLH